VSGSKLRAFHEPCHLGRFVIGECVTASHRLDTQGYVTEVEAVKQL
jgi:hypothetical protein